MEKHSMINSSDIQSRILQYNDLIKTTEQKVKKEKKIIRQLESQIEAEKHRGYYLKLDIDKGSIYYY